RGLATALSLAPTHVTLCLQAPDVRFELTFPRGAPPIELSANNVLADAVLTPAPTAAAPGTGATIRPSQSDLANQQRWMITPPLGGGAIGLRIAPADADTPGSFRFAVFGD